MKCYFILFSVLFFVLFSFGLNSSFATVNNFTTDKSLYHLGDSIKITGNVNYDSTIPSIIVQVINPSGSGLAHVDVIIPQNDGTFTKTLNAGGPTWNENGKYVIKIYYDGILEKSFDYEKFPDESQSSSSQSSSSQSSSSQSSSSQSSSSQSSSSQSSSSQSSSSQSSSSQPSSIPHDITEQKLKPLTTDTVSDLSFTENPKMRIFGFPSFDKSPQYYIDRYNTEPQYRSWFDSQFPLYQIDDVVGYEITHIDNFPSFDKSPQYYIDRYNTEPQYRSWFDSQFPGKTIYDILGFSTFIPDWIKTYAKNWTADEISDSEFISGLNFMLQNKIVVIPNVDYIHYTVDEIPPWFRNTSHWWSNDLISQQEFINSLKFLIQKDIILIE